MNIVLNDSTPALSPTNGCCASITDSSYVYVEMKVSGSPGSSTSTINVTSSVTTTTLYYVGVSGDYNGQTINAGTWTVPIHVASILNNTGLIDSIYICQANSSGTSIATIGSATGLSYNVGTGTHSFSISGSSATFSTGDVVIISFQMHYTSGAGFRFTLDHDQTITPPAAALPPNPVQTKTGCSSDSNLDLTFSSVPTVGNAIAVAATGYLSQSYLSPLVCSDNYGNSYQSVFEKTINSSVGGVQLMQVFFARVVSTGTSFTVTVDTQPFGSSRAVSFRTPYGI